MYLDIDEKQSNQISSGLSGEKYDKIGQGVSQYLSDYTGDISPFSQEYLLERQKVTEQKTNRFQNFVETKESYYKQTQKSSGLGIDLGFMKLGHKSSKTEELNFNKHTINYLALGRKTSAVVSLSEDADNIKFSQKAQQYIDNKDAENFYHYFGTHYVSKIQLGLYVNILISFNFESQDKAESKKKEIKAKLISEDGSADGSLGNNKEFHEFYASNNGTFYLEHNIPTSIVDGLKHKTTSIQGALDLLALVDTIADEQAMPISYSVTEYLLNELWGDSVKKNDKILKNIDFSELSSDCEIQLGKLDLYSENPSLYKKIDQYETIQKHYNHELKYLNDLIEGLDKELFYDTKDDTDKLNDLHANIPEFSLIRNKIDIDYKQIQTSSGKDLLEKLTSEADGHWLPKYSAADIKSHNARGVVFFNKNEIQIPTKQPNSSTQWLQTKIEETSDDYSNLYKKARTALNKLTPIQFFYCSVVFTNAKSNKARIVVYYPKL